MGKSLSIKRAFVPVGVKETCTDSFRTVTPTLYLDILVLFDSDSNLLKRHAFLLWL